MKNSPFRHPDGSLKMIGGGDFTATVDEIKSAFENYKRLNDARIAEVEKFGTASVAAQEAADKANTAITELQTKLDGVPGKLEELENKIARDIINGPGRAGRLSDEQRVHYANWQTALEVQQGKRKSEDPIDPADVDVEFCVNYGKAFRNYLRTGQKNEMLVGSDVDGGIFVDPDMSGRTISYIYETSPLRQYASVQTITGDKLEGDLDLQEPEDGWVGETESRPETDTPQVFEWSIPLREQYALPSITQRLADFANRDVGAWLEGKIRRKFSRSEGTSFVSGATPKKPRGFLTYTAGTPGTTIATWPRIRQVASGETYVAGSAGLTADGLIDLIYALNPIYAPGAILAGNRATEAEIRKLKDGNGAYLWQTDFTEKRQARVLGVPYVDFPDMPNIGTDTLPLAIANFAEGYQIVDSPIGVRVLRDNVTTKGRVKYYTTRYVGGDVLDFQAIVLHKIAAS